MLPLNDLLNEGENFELERRKALNRQKCSGCSCPAYTEQTCKLILRNLGQKGKNAGGEELG